MKEIKKSTQSLPQTEKKSLWGVQRPVTPPPNLGNQGTGSGQGGNGQKKGSTGK